MDKLKSMFGSSGSGSSSGGASATPAPAPAGAVENPDKVVLHTTLGAITIQLFSQQTPRTCQ